MSDEINDGDVVKLKSGGPPLTVAAIASNGTATVIWFDDDGTFHETCINANYLAHSAPFD